LGGIAAQKIGARSWRVWTASRRWRAHRAGRAAEREGGPGLEPNVRPTEARLGRRIAVRASATGDATRTMQGKRAEIARECGLLTRMVLNGRCVLQAFRLIPPSAPTVEGCSGGHRRRPLRRSNRTDDRG
jgi:hypothetical protein